MTITINIYQAEITVAGKTKPLTKSIAMQFPVRDDGILALRLFESHGMRLPYGKVLGSTLNASSLLNVYRNEKIKPSDYRYVDYNNDWFLLLDDGEAGLVWKAYRNPNIDNVVYPQDEPEKPTPAKPEGLAEEWWAEWSKYKVIQPSLAKLFATQPSVLQEYSWSNRTKMPEQLRKDFAEKWEQSPERTAYEAALEQWQEDYDQWGENQITWKETWLEVEREMLAEIPTLIL